MKRLTLSGMLILIALFAFVFALFARLGGEAFFFVTGPILGALLAAFAHRGDRWALVVGGIVGGLCQGIFAFLVLGRGSIFPAGTLITGAHFLATLGVHMLVGLVVGTLLHLAFRRAAPRNPPGLA